MTAARPPRWGDLPLDRLEELVRHHASPGLRLATASGLSGSAFLGQPGLDGERLLVDELIALARWAVITRKIADDHPRWSAGRVLGAADDVAAGAMSLAAAEGLK